MDEMQNLYITWKNRAEDDLEAARSLLKLGHSPSIIGMLVCQSLEKLFKGFLLYKGWKLKKTHNLNFLSSQMYEMDLDLMSYDDDFRRITEYYKDERYPPFGGNITVDMAERAVQIADDIFSVTDKFYLKNF